MGVCGSCEVLRRRREDTLIGGAFSRRTQLTRLTLRAKKKPPAALAASRSRKGSVAYLRDEIVVCGAGASSSMTHWPATHTERPSTVSQCAGHQRWPSRGAGNASTDSDSGLATLADHSTSASGHIVHATVGTDALAMAQIAKPAEMIRWTRLMDGRGRGTASGYVRPGTISASRARFL